MNLFEFSTKNEAETMQLMNSIQTAKQFIDKYIDGWEWYCAITIDHSLAEIFHLANQFRTITIPQILTLDEFKKGTHSLFTHFVDIKDALKSLIGVYRASIASQYYKDYVVEDDINPHWSEILKNIDILLAKDPFES